MEPGLNCSFCGKSQHQVAKLVAGPGVYICNECIDLCNQIITDEQSPLADRDVDNLLAMAGSVFASQGRQLTELVKILRQREVTWTRIGAALGMTRQSAWERFSGEE